MAPSLSKAFREAAGCSRPLPKCRTTTAPISLRMTFEEKARLERDAAGLQSGFVQVCAARLAMASTTFLGKLSSLAVSFIYPAPTAIL